MHTGLSPAQIKRKILSKETIDMPRIDHVYINNCGNIDMKYVEDQVKLHEDVLQKSIDVVCIDYIGLMKKSGHSRYMDLSAHVESFKGFLTSTGRTGMISTQVSRPPDKEEGYFRCPSIFDAKDSGSIENSAQIYFMLWRTDPEDRRALGLRVGKYSHDIPDYPSQIDLASSGFLIGTQEKIDAKRTVETKEMFNGHQR